MSMNIETSMAAVEAAAIAGVPVMMVGAPATTKTVTLHSWAEAIGYHLETQIGSRMTPTSTTGIPFPSEHEIDGVKYPVTDYLMPKWQYKVIKDKKVLLFFDEFSNSTISVMSSLQSIVQDRQWPNLTRIPRETMIICAMNPEESATDYNAFSSSLANRFFWIHWNPPMKHWLDGMRDGFAKPASEISPANYELQEKDVITWASLIADFIEKNPGFLHVEPNEVEVPEAYGIEASPERMTVLLNAWPSRRSWYNLARSLAALDMIGKTSNAAQDLLAEGLVGIKSSRAWRRWLNANRFMDIEKVLARPSSVEWKTISVEELITIIQTAVSIMDEKNYKKVLTLFGHVAKADRRGHVATHFQPAIKKAMGLPLSVTDKAAFKEWINPLRKAYQDSLNSNRRTMPKDA